MALIRFQDDHRPPLPLHDGTRNDGQFQDVHQLQPPRMDPARIDWHDTPPCYVVKADLSGFPMRDVKVEIDDGRVLCISGQKKFEREEKRDQGQLVVSVVGKFTRRFQLPENAMVDKVTAHKSNATLTVTVPKRNTIKKLRVQPRRIQITAV